MSVFSGPNIVRDNLIFNLDAGTNKSYNSTAHQRTLINTDTWTLGTGSVTNFPVNGQAGESQRLYDTSPFGSQAIVWKTLPTADGGADGGWEGSLFNINPKQLYRSSVWVRRTSTNTAGNSYHGLHTNGTGDVIQLDGNSNGNFYFDTRGIGSYKQNQWYLLVSHVFPSSHTGTTSHPDSGIYSPSSGLTKVMAMAGTNGLDVKFPANATQAMQRVYHYYSGDPNSNLEFAFPRWEVIDGSEPTVGQLLADMPETAKSVGRTLNIAQPFNQPGFSSAGAGSFTFNGTNQNFFFPNDTKLDVQEVTVECWIKTNALSQSGFWFEKGSVNSQYALFQEGSNIQWRTNIVELGTYHSQSTPSSNLSTSAWAQVVGTFTSGSKITYINGAAITSATVTGVLNTNASGITVGSYNSNGYYYNGNIAIVRVYNKALSAAEVNQNFQANRRRFGI